MIGNSIFKRLRALRRSKLCRDQSGLSALEFAFAVPAALLMLLMVVEFGRAVFTQGSLYFAAEEATRWGIVNPTATSTQIEDYAESKVLLQKVVDHPQFVVTATPTPNADNTVTMTVVMSVPFEFSVPVGNLIPITLTASSEGFLAPPL